MYDSCGERQNYKEGNGKLGMMEEISYPTNEDSLFLKFCRVGRWRQIGNVNETDIRHSPEAIHRPR
jgi:hypothetical protein